MQTVAEPRGYFGSWETGSQAAVILESRAKKQQHHREEKMREVLIFNATYLILDMSGDMLQEAKATVELSLIHI